MRAIALSFRHTQASFRMPPPSAGRLYKPSPVGEGGPLAVDEVLYMQKITKLIRADSNSLLLWKKVAGEQRENDGWGVSLSLHIKKHLLSQVFYVFIN